MDSMRYAREAKEFYKLGREAHNNPIWLRLIELSIKHGVSAYIRPFNGEVKTVHDYQAAGRLKMYNDGNWAT
ncbi:hypothetical protein [Desulfoscipio gibsoniae]|uniref:Uncharacterized protein n=1 Tax=Desulfoscipio gibsoniae DSM 7213 TaxID=767817 RepID=R4KIE8_9FIRM|nr:hypothetical protein [Desulfoscipio gibsoniae]AGL02973.1 hypothetical protein Desgi_3650 [Desulfoscipio gibsoniae DSM 7213]